MITSTKIYELILSGSKLLPQLIISLITLGLMVLLTTTNPIQILLTLPMIIILIGYWVAILTKQLEAGVMFD